MDEPPLASLSLTHVHYNPADPVSLACAWLALVPQALCIVYVTLIWSSREVEVALMFAGQLACKALNGVLKRWIKEERPMRMYGDGYGMPSDHAQFCAFFAVSLALFLVKRHKLSRQSSEAERLALSVLALVGASTVAASRVYLNYHTPYQVFVGSAAGTIFALLWFLLTSVARQQGLVDRLLDLAIARYLRVRDLLITEDLVQAGWERWQLASKLRARKQRSGHPARKSN